MPETNLSNANTNTHVYSHLAQTMITSSTPFLFYGISNSSGIHNSQGTLHLLTTHHGGGVQVTNTHELPLRVNNQRKGHHVQ